MQNWFEGNLRIRGAIKQIREFMHLLVADKECTRWIFTMYRAAQLL